MDHFSREDEQLTRAMDNDTLQRNFQGYSTLAGADLYGFGMSAISSVGGDFYWQNSKDLVDYYQALNLTKGLIHKLLHLCNDSESWQDGPQR